MAKTRTEHRCSHDGCGWTGPKWQGRCPDCKEYGSISETAAEVGSTGGAKTAASGLRSSLAGTAVALPAQRVRDIDLATAKRTPTGVGEFDRVLGGGLVPGGVVLLAGEPGTGKSTLLLQVANLLAAQGPVLYVSGEESRAQIRLRAERTGADAHDLWIADESDLGTIIGHIDEVRPRLLIVDSVQTVASGDIDGTAGGVSQVKEVSAALTKVAKNRGLPTILVGQSTKTGDAAGPQSLMHIVDAVFLFEGDEHSSLRLIRTMKNRFGSADEVACFQMTATGIEEVPDPSGLFLTQRDEPVSGTCVTVVMEGRRAMPAEVQALVTPSPLAQPRRGVSGLDKPRVDMLIAVVQSQAKLKLWERDVFMATIGGQKLAEPAADLAGVLALVSAYEDMPLPPDVVALGEVALSGDIRAVAGLARRLDEARRLGFKRAFVPPGSQTEDYRRANPRGGMALVEVANVARAVQAVRSSPASR